MPYLISLSRNIYYLTTKIRFMLCIQNPWNDGSLTMEKFITCLGLKTLGNSPPELIVLGNDVVLVCLVSDHSGANFFAKLFAGSTVFTHCVLLAVAAV